jgi:hypothetical protein
MSTIGEQYGWAPVAVTPQQEKTGTPGPGGLLDERGLLSLLHQYHSKAGLREWVEQGYYGDITAGAYEKLYGEARPEDFVVNYNPDFVDSITVSKNRTRRGALQNDPDYDGYQAPRNAGEAATINGREAKVNYRTPADMTPEEQGIFNAAPTPAAPAPAAPAPAAVGPQPNPAPTQLPWDSTIPLPWNGMMTPMQPPVASEPASFEFQLGDASNFWTSPRATNRSGGDLGTFNQVVAGALDILTTRENERADWASIDDVDMGGFVDPRNPTQNVQQFDITYDKGPLKAAADHIKQQAQEMGIDLVTLDDGKPYFYNTGISALNDELYGDAWRGDNSFSKTPGTYETPVESAGFLDYLSALAPMLAAGLISPALAAQFGLQGSIGLGVTAAGVNAGTQALLNGGDVDWGDAAVSGVVAGAGDWLGNSGLFDGQPQPNVDVVPGSGQFVPNTLDPSVAAPGGGPIGSLAEYPAGLSPTDLAIAAATGPAPNVSTVSPWVDPTDPRVIMNLTDSVGGNGSVVGSIFGSDFPGLLGAGLGAYNTVNEQRIDTGQGLLGDITGPGGRLDQIILDIPGGGQPPETPPVVQQDQQAGGGGAGGGGGNVGSGANAGGSSGGGAVSGGGASGGANADGPYGSETGTSDWIISGRGDQGEWVWTNQATGDTYTTAAPDYDNPPKPLFDQDGNKIEDGENRVPWLLTDRDGNVVFDMDIFDSTVLREGWNQIDPEGTLDGDMTPTDQIESVVVGYENSGQYNDRGDYVIRNSDGEIIQTIPADIANGNINEVIDGEVINNGDEISEDEGPADMPLPILTDDISDLDSDNVADIIADVDPDVVVDDPADQIIDTGDTDTDNDTDTGDTGDGDDNDGDGGDSGDGDDGEGDDGDNGDGDGDDGTGDGDGGDGPGGTGTGGILGAAAGDSDLLQFTAGDYAASLPANLRGLMDYVAALRARLR